MSFDHLKISIALILKSMIMDYNYSYSLRSLATSIQLRMLAYLLLVDVRKKREI